MSSRRLRHFGLIASLALAAALSGCTVTRMQVLPPDALAAAPAWPVTGRQGWMPNRSLLFGDYATRDLKTRQRGHTRNCPNGCANTNLGLYKHRFDEAFETSTQRTQFTLVGPGGAEVDVQFTGQLDQQRRQWMTQWFGVPTDYGAESAYKVHVIGTMQPADPTQTGWRFALRDDGTAQLQGWVEDDNGRRLVMSPLRRMTGRHAGEVFTLPHEVGHAFELDGRIVAAVATAGTGTVWISPALPSQMRLSLAGLASALLVRQQR